MQSYSACWRQSAHCCRSSYTHSALYQIRDLALKFLYIAIASGVVSYIEMAAWMWSGNRQINRLRQQYLEALLKQDVAYFDTEGTTGQALQGLNEDCQLIQVHLLPEEAGSWGALACDPLPGPWLALPLHCGHQTRPA